MKRLSSMGPADTLGSPLFGSAAKARLPITVFGKHRILDFVRIGTAVEAMIHSRTRCSFCGLATNYLGRIAKNTISSAATNTIPTMPRIKGKLDFLAGGAAVIFGMAGCAMAGGAKAWGGGEANGADGVAEVCPNVS